MPVLPNYTQFSGRHWETGSVANVLDYQFSNSELALSEAMLLGISGGVAFGYFVFDYKDADPHLALLSRNTFDPLDTLLERLAIPQDLYHTTSAVKAERNLIEVLESGRPAIVWADAYSLPYNVLPGEEMWAMMPIVVYGLENGTAHIADRSSKALTVTKEELLQARARIKKDKFRVLALGAPNLAKLPDAIREGIHQCIALYKEAPPKGGKDNFGFAAYEKWASLLTNTRNKQSWARLLPPGSRMYAALAGSAVQPGAFGWARTFPSNQVDDRIMYADFLDEAARTLDAPNLSEAGERFRESSAAWQALSETLLPEDVPVLKETRELLIEKRELFVEQGGEAVEPTREINARLDVIRDQVASDFPMSDMEVVALRENLAKHVRKIAEVDRRAVEMLEAAMA